MQVKIGIGLVAAVLVGALAWRSVHAEDAAPTAPAEPAHAEVEMAAKGKALYAQHCSHCHGFSMVNSGTVAYDLRQFPHDAKARFVHSVSQGKNGRMPAWGDLLKSTEIDEIWAYVMTGGK